jgi:hypothetical protein
MAMAKYDAERQVCLSISARGIACGYRAAGERCECSPSHFALTHGDRLKNYSSAQPITNFQINLLGEFRAAYFAGFAAHSL